MSGKYPIVSWKELAKLVESYGYVLKSQRGSHMKFVLGKRSMIVIPKHKVISIGVLKSVLKKVSSAVNVPVDELLKKL